LGRTTDERAMARALELARRGPPGENPQVGCVVLNLAGEIVGEGWHEGAGAPHAEAMALAEAGGQAHGGTAVVTLEPCAHHGRTPPCAEALLAAGVARVVVGQRDPNPVAAGGAAVLRDGGVQVEDQADPVLAERVGALVRRWARALELGRPFVTWKLATTLDGRSAAADGSSRWITGPAARADVHRLRAEHDTVLVGTGTALTDDPALTVRDAAGRASHWQPRRAVMGQRALRAGARLTAGVPAMIIETREPVEALAELWAVGSRQVLLEGGPTVAAAFVQVGLIDEVVAYVAPALLGAGAAALGDLGVSTIGEALRFELVEAAVLDGDVRLTLRPVEPPSTVRP
jgi:diaminohydroxyphosphoribosylaminopyrimidine deaminase/5-amino-6-(5-phosphoribosylamino)uracil reductase